LRGGEDAGVEEMAPPRAFHVMTKPTGPICNLDCAYCFYLEKEALYPGERSWRMSDQVLERYVERYITEQDSPVISFAWQGGEPTLMGLDFFRRVVALQRRHCPRGKRIENALQTNGVLLDNDWARFCAEHGFLVGISIDGPADLHDRYRVDKGGKPTHAKVMAAIERCARHGVEFNTLTVVNRVNAREPGRVYRFLAGIGSVFHQYIPIVERHAEEADLLDLAAPEEADRALTDWSVTPELWGDFLCGVYDAWIRRDVGRVFVQLFEVQLGILVGGPAQLCVFAERCGTGLAMEHNGDVYACDHYVYPAHCLGNVVDDALSSMVDSPQQRAFGAAKADLPRMCRECEYLVQCRGECPKHRVATTPDGEPGLNHLCAGYRRFFAHSRPGFDRIIDLVRRGLPAAQVMEDFRRPARRSPAETVAPAFAPDLSCPCGSGRRFAACCGRGAAAAR